MNTDIDYTEKAREFLKSHLVSVLSTVAPDNTPYAAVIYTIVDDNFNFFFITKVNTAKSQNMEQNKNVALTIVDTSTLITVQVKGTIHNMEIDANYSEIFLKISEAISKYTDPPLSKLKNSGEFVLYKLETKWLRYGDFSDKNKAEGNAFHQIIPATT